MKILLLGNSQSSHTIKWVKGLHARGVEVILFSFDKPNGQTIQELEGVKVSLGRYDGKVPRHYYFIRIFELWNLYKSEKPDIVHAHFLSLYGIIRLILPFKKFFISVWGSDIFMVPRKSKIHRFLITKALRKADRIFSTSQIMKVEIQKYVDKDVEVIPFGIDTGHFKPLQVKKDQTVFKVGAVKSLYPIYGLDNLIKAAVTVKNRFPEISLSIYGDGPQKATLQSLINSLDAMDYIKLEGRVSHQDVPLKLSELDLFCNLSHEESFGVSVLEASACEVPVLVTNVGGLPEVVKDEVTGRLVKDDLESIITIFEYCIESIQNGVQWGVNGSKFVTENYEWEISLDKMIKNYIE